MRQTGHSDHHSDSHISSHSGSHISSHASRHTGSHASSRSSGQAGKRSHQRGKAPRSELKTLLLFYILPFIVVNGIIFYLATAKPKYHIEIGETNDYISTTVTLTIDSHLPTKNLTMSLNGEALTLEKQDRKTYTAVITQNGTVEATLENFNGMSVAQFENVSVLDDGPPEITSYTIEDGVLTVKLSDSQSGVDFNSIHAIDSTGNQLTPTSIDKFNSEVTFDMDDNGLTMYISDYSGNEVEQPFSVTEE